MSFYYYDVINNLRLPIVCSHCFSPNIIIPKTNKKRTLLTSFKEIFFPIKPSCNKCKKEVPLNWEMDRRIEIRTGNLSKSSLKFVAVTYKDNFYFCNISNKKWFDKLNDAIIYTYVVEKHINNIKKEINND